MHPKRLPLAGDSEISVLAFHAKRVAVARALAPPATPAAILGAAAELFSFGDGVMRVESGPEPLACGVGCTYCCHVEVASSTPEVFFAAERLRRSRGADGLAVLGEALENAVGALAAQRAAWRALRVPCAFLGEGGACAIYVARPLACRGWTSRDVGACERGFESGDASARVPLDEGRMRAASAVSFAMYQGATDVGLDGRPVRFVAAVRAALTDPAWIERWARGERVPDELVDPGTTRAWSQNQYPPLAESAVLAAGV
jgi:hypothetical protein